MREIKAINPQTTAIYRFDGKLIYLKVNNEAAGQQFVAKIVQMGGKIVKAKGWFRVDIFNENTYVKLGSLILDLTILTDKEVEDKLFDFFEGFLKMSGFKVEVNNV